jgi:hypothetical protein
MPAVRYVVVLKTANPDAGLAAVVKAGGRS